MFSKVVNSINDPVIKTSSVNVNGTNKSATSCTVASCKAPSGCNLM